MWRRFRVLLLQFLLLPTAGVAAQTHDVWIGRPTVGDHLRRDFGNMLAAQQNYARNKAAFNREIAQARKDFFAPGKTAAARSAIEKKFADMLFAKDLMYATTFIAEGFSKESRIRSEGFQTLSGGAIDGGLRPQAQREFEEWVNGMRKALGAQSPTQLLFLTDPARLEGALQANEALYAVYAEQRDVVEFAESDNPAAREIARRYWILPEGMAPDGWARLHKQEIRPIHSGAYRLDLLNATLRRQLAAVAKAGQQKVLDCTYGPLRGARGGPVYRTYTFWHNAPPPDITSYLEIDRERALATIGAVAMTACPASEKGAGAALREAVAAHPWSEANRARATAAPPSAAPPKVDTTGMTPAEARAAIRRGGN